MNWLKDLIAGILDILPRSVLVNPDEGTARTTLGKYVKLLGPGWYFYWPLIQTMQTIAVTPQVVDVRVQSVRTKDGTDLAIELAVRYRITNAASAQLKVLDYDRSLQNSSLVACVEYMGNIDIDDLLVDDVNTKLTELVQKKAWGWGIDVQSVGITDLGKTTNIRVLGNTPIIPLEDEK